MLLKNKKTGEIVEFRYLQSDHVAPLMLTTYEKDKPEMYTYNSLVELKEEWEDYEEPKEYWWIDTGSIPMVRKSNNPILSTAEDIDKEIGNYFETKEEAKKAVEKLKALKRLKDKGMRTYSFKREKRGIDLDFYTLTILAPRDKDSLGLLFGGEE